MSTQQEQENQPLEQESEHSEASVLDQVIAVTGKDSEKDYVEDLVKSFILKNIIDISIEKEDKISYADFKQFDKYFVLFLSHIKKSRLEI